jgi:hypothetical protein
MCMFPMDHSISKRMAYLFLSKFEGPAIGVPRVSPIIHFNGRHINKETLVRNDWWILERNLDISRCQGNGSFLVRQ